MGSILPHKGASDMTRVLRYHHNIIVEWSGSSGLFFNNSIGRPTVRSPGSTLEGDLYLCKEELL